MKRVLLILLIVFVLIVAAASKPDDKSCIIAAVNAVWGSRVPSLSMPQYYEQFMDVTSQSVEINDWWLLKRIRYKTNKGKMTVGYGAFRHVFITL